MLSFCADSAGRRPSDHMGEGDVKSCFETTWAVYALYGNGTGWPNVGIVVLIKSFCAYCAMRASFAQVPVMYAMVKLGDIEEI